VNDPAPDYLIDLVVKNCTVLTMDPDGTVVPSGALGIDQGVIVWIGADADAATIPAEQVIDGHGAILMPGLFDTHFHTGQQLLRGKLVELAATRHLKLPIWKNYLIPFESVLTEDDVYWSAKLAYANMLRAGTTCFADAGGPHPDQMARAALETGIRGVVAQSTVDMGDGMPARAKMTTQRAIDTNIELVKRWAAEGEGRVSAWLSLRQIIVCTPELWHTFAEVSAELGCRIHTHLAEGTYEVDFTTEQYGKRPADWLESIGFMSDRAHFAHSVLLSDGEVELMGHRHVSVGHCPVGNFRIGPPKVHALRRAGVRVGLGSDGASSGTIDLLQASRVFRTGFQSVFATPWHVFAEQDDIDFLHMATAGGAAAMGMDDIVGTVQVGKRADVLVVEGDFLDALPALDPLFVVSRCATGRDVTTVIVDGRVVMRDRKLLTVDEDALTEEIKERSRAIMARFDAVAA
jgi:5-methylthioadenosine/S-adenosylhomocysteine deaminase